MSKDVLISIRGTQHSEGEDPQTIELTTSGELYRRDQALCVSYVESEMTGLEGVLTTFQVEKSQIRLVREGSLNSTMTFIQGQATESLYDMGFGAMLLRVTADKVQSNLRENGGSFSVDYSVEVERVPVGSHSYEITVQEALPS